MEILYTHSDRVKCLETSPVPAARTMNPSVNFPSDTLLPAMVDRVKPDIKPAAQIVRDIVREAEQVIAERAEEKGTDSGFVLSKDP